MPSHITLKAPDVRDEEKESKGQWPERSKSPSLSLPTPFFSLSLDQIGKVRAGDLFSFLALYRASLSCWLYAGKEAPCFF